MSFLLQPMETKKRRSEKPVPEDLVPDIVSRLPAKDLVRLTCVSKSWRSLISTDSRFHRLQAQRTAPSDRQKPFLRIEVRSLINTYFAFDNYWVDLESVENNPSFDLESIEGNSNSIDNPFDHHDFNNYWADLEDNPFEDYEPPRRDNLVMGSCHGLLLHQQQHTMNLAVSNPTTNEHVMLPPNPADDVSPVFCGFGYDRVHDCYKVVLKVEQLFELMVYDLTKGAWGRVRFGAWWRAKYSEFDNVPYWYLETKDDDYKMNRWWNDYSSKSVDGVVYWCVDDGQWPREMTAMVCFLLAEEEFHVVEPPDLGEAMYYPILSVLDDRLCLLCQASDERTVVWSHTRVDYDDDGERQVRWTKLFEISDPYVKLSRDSSYCAALIPVCFSAGGDKVLFCVFFDQLFWYDLEKEEFRKFSDRIVDSLAVNPCVSRMGDLGFLLKNKLG